MATPEPRAEIIAPLDELRPDDVVVVHEGGGPIILGEPHIGLAIPRDVATGLNDTALAIADTDWWVDRLYDGLVPDATVVSARLSRYVIDLNRDPSGETLYPGQNTTGLCPLTDFDGRSIYREGHAPDQKAISQRLAAVHVPYHAALQEQINRLRARHDNIILYDCHSIRSSIPYLFEGRLPVFNIGTNNATTCKPELEQAVVEACLKHAPDEIVLNGRFKGGWVTRTYGRPETGIHAIQMELAQRAYLTEEAPPWAYNDAVAGPTRDTLADVFDALRHGL